MIDRRQFLGGLSLTGVTLPFLSANEEVVSAPLKERAKSVIYIWLPGGMSQYETFNVDFNKESLGKSEPIKTNVDGLRISHYMPQMAKHMDKVHVVNSVHINQGAHPSAIYKSLTSYNPRSSITHPEIGAWVSKFKSESTDTLPNFVSINSSRTGTAGFFPGMYAALPVRDPASGIKYSSYHKGVSEKRFNKRLGLLERLNNDFDAQHGNEQTVSYTDVYQNSIKFMKSKDIEAFDLKKEDASISKLYAKDRFSQGCLLAARLAEKGVKFNKVELGGWDYHQQLYTNLPGNASKLDKGLSALLQHLTLKGLLETTLVVVATEFGRTPEINVNQGRDHHPKGYTCLLAGAGVKSGEVTGKMSQDAKEILEKPIDVRDFNATIAWAMGLEPNVEVQSPSGRPMKLSNKGKAVTEVFS